ncbi:MAG: tetratricopeptide repeat protein [Bacteroidota bacterium]
MLILRVQAQQHEVDSLVSVFEALAVTGVEEVDQINRMANYSTNSYPVLAQQFAEKAIATSKALSYTRGEAQGLLNLAMANRTVSNLPKALENGFDAYFLMAQDNDSASMARALTDISLFYKELGEPDSAITYLRKSLALNSRDLETRGLTLNNLGSAFLDIDGYDSARKYYNLALAIRKEIKDLKGLAVTYGNLGILSSQDEQDFLKAKAYYELSVDMKLENRDFFNLAYSYINLGNLYRNDEQYARASTYYQLAIAYTDSANAIGVKSAAYRRWARSERRAGNERVAQKYDSTADAIYVQVLQNRQDTELAQLRAGIRLKEKQQELELRNKDIKLLQKDKSILVLQVIALSLVVATLAFFVWIQRSRRRKQSELEKAKATQLESEIEHKTNELSLITVNFIQKQQMMEELQVLAKHLRKDVGSNALQEKVKSINRILSDQKRNDKEWENWRVFFEKVHTGFFRKLQAKYTDLTVTELRLAAMIKMNLSIKETASILSIAPDSVKTARSRLRAKLGLTRDQNLVSFLMEF